MSVLAVVHGAGRDLGGGFRVQRLLPALGRDSVGPFVFFDHFGPVTVEPADNFDVRPHPHIGLATVTYLYEGAMMHRDSTGAVQRIEPRAINWMSAGSGIVHSERRPEDLAGRSYVLHGLQLWTALPRAAEESAPTFVHTPAAALPQFREGDAEVRVLVGSAWGRTSPVATLASVLYVAIRLEAGGEIVIPPLAAELAIYALDAAVDAGGTLLGERSLAIVDAGRAVRLRAVRAAQLVLIGGERLDGPRKLWWNFVSSRPERIDEAARAWAEGRMPAIAGETEFIALPSAR